MIALRPRRFRPHSPRPHSPCRHTPCRHTRRRECFGAALPATGLLLTALALALTIVLAWGLVSCERRDSAASRPGVREYDFNEYRGTESSLPDAIFVTGEDGNGEGIGDGFYPFTGVSSIDPERSDEFQGFGAFTRDDQEYSFGIRERGDTDLRNARLFLEYTNDTDRTIHGFRVSYDVETWFLGERDNRIRLKYHTQTSGFGSIETIVSTANPRGAAGNERDIGAIDGSRPENRTRVETTFMLEQLRGQAEDGLDAFAPLEPGRRGYFRWQYSNHRVTDGAIRSGLAVNNVKIEPLFAPPTPSGERASGDDGHRTAHGPIAFSHDPGFYSQPLELTLTSSLPNATIYYTVDGSRPDPANLMSDQDWEELPRESRARTFEYTDPIEIATLLERENDISLINTSRRTDHRGWVEPTERVPKAANIRAVAKAQYSRSAHRGASFFVFNESGDKHRIPVWSINSDRAGLFESENGIYVPGRVYEDPNYFRRGVEWERPAQVEFFEVDGERKLAQEMGIRIHGNFTRTFAQKSLRLYSRTDYGPGRMSYRFFDSKEIEDFNRLLVRNGGNDWFQAMLTDSTLQTLVQHLPFDTQHYRPSVLYLNGEYWGIHNIRDRYDQHYLETHYDIPRDEVVILEIEGVVHTGEHGQEEPYLEFRERLSEGELSGWDEINEYMALSEYLDYLFAQVYAGNYDWPFNNIRYWRYTGDDVSDEAGPRDGRWRWLMYDMDFTFGHKYSTTFDMVDWTFGHTAEHPFYAADRRDREQDRFELNHRLMDHDEIRHEFLQRFATHLSATVSEARAAEHVTRQAQAIEHEIPRQVERWQRPLSVEYWKEQVQEMQDFAARRPEIMRAQLMRHFDEIDRTVEITVAGLERHTDLTLHTIALNADTPGVEISNGSWTGQLFAGIPVVLVSETSDLAEFTISPSEHVSELVQTRDRVSFTASGPVELAPTAP